jgi:hypothetical protein
MTMKIEKTLSQRVRDANNENNEPRRGNKIVVRKNTTGPGMKATTAIDNPGLEEISLNVLYERLRLQEVQLSEDAFKWLQVQFANQRFFSYPIFDPPHDFSDKSRESLSDPGVKYNFLLLLLRTCRTREDRLFMLATWLHLEGICPPEDLLGEDFSQYRRKAPPGSRGRLSFTDLRQAFIVNTWELYFKRLLLAQRNGLDLRQLGFDEGAIQSASGKRSAVAAAGAYVCGRLGVDAPALANAYSRVFSRVKKKNSGLPMHDDRPVS